MKKEIYNVCVERNDKGWEIGEIYFKHPEDAIKHMRKFVANLICDKRRKNCKIELLRIFKDSSMNSILPKVPVTQTIDVRIKQKDGSVDFYEFRVWATTVYGTNEYSRIFYNML